MPIAPCKRRKKSEGRFRGCDRLTVGSQTADATIEASLGSKLMLARNNPRGCKIL